MKKSTIFILTALLTITSVTFAAQDWNSSRSNKTSKTQVAPNSVPETGLTLEVSSGDAKPLESVSFHHAETKAASWEDAIASAVKESSKKIDTSSPDLMLHDIKNDDDCDGDYCNNVLKTGGRTGGRADFQDMAIETEMKIDLKDVIVSVNKEDIDKEEAYEMKKDGGSPDLMLHCENGKCSKGDKEEAYSINGGGLDKEEAYEMRKDGGSPDLVFGNAINSKGDKEAYVNDEGNPKFKVGKNLRDAHARQEDNANENDVVMKIGGDDPIPGIDVIVKRDPSSRPIFDEEGNELDGSISAIIKRAVKEQKNVWAKPSQKELKVVAIKGKDAEVKEVKINDDNTMSIKAKQPAKLFGFITMDVEVEAKMDAQGVIQAVDTPWYSFLLWGN